MKVKILVGMAGVGFVYQAGGIYNLPPGEADEYIRLGRAEVVEEPKQRAEVVEEPNLPPGEADEYIRLGREEVVEEPKQRKVIVQRFKKTAKRPVK